MNELFRYFLFLGATGFGGPLMLIQQMREHYVTETSQMTAAEFDKTFTLIKAMPGPIAFQMAVFLGNRYLGFRGGLAAGFAFLLPSFLMMLLFGYFYSSFVSISFIHPILDGFLFSVSAVILISLKSLVISNYRNLIFGPLVLINMWLSWKNVVPEPVLIVGFGLLTILLMKHSDRLKLFSAAFFFIDWPAVVELFKICLVSGAVVFGTGLALIPVLKTSFVDVHQWLTLKEFSDGVIFGQMSPGPVTITGAFLGYQISGLAGALAAVLGIFFMPFVHMVTWFPRAVGWLSRQSWIADFLVGATAAVVGSILVTVLVMNKNSANNPMFWLIFISSFLIMFKRPKTAIVLLILVSGLVNLLSFAAFNAV